MKGIKDNTDTWKYMLFSWTTGLNIVKMSTLARALYRFNATLPKYELFFFFFFFFYRSKTYDPKIHMEPQRTPKGEHNL